MSAPSAPLTSPWPLTGRHEELEEAVAALSDSCPALFLVGEAGSGKTRLAREILRVMESDGWPVAGATATESARATPLGALTHLVPAGVLDAPHTMVHAAREAVEARGDGRPLVLHVDDAHHLDPLSASLLVSLAESGSARLVITLRPGGLAPDAIVALRAADRARTLTLRSLDALAIDTLLHRVLGAPLDGAAEAQLLETSGGNPLYLRELVLGAVADGTLREVAGVWRLSGALPASEALSERVLGRMATLTESARAALELIAVGEPIGLDLLETMIDPDVLEQLEDGGLLRVDQDERRTEVRLAHPVYGEILRGSLGRVRLRRLSRLHAERITALGARRHGDALRVVRWQIDAGIAPEPDVVMASARLARHHQDWTTTASLSRAALAAGAHDAASLLAEAHFELGEFEEVERVVADALADEAILGETARVHLHRTRALAVMWGHDDNAGAAAILEEVAAGVSDPELVDLLTFSRAATAAWSGRIADSRALIGDLVDSPQPAIAVQAALIVELLGSLCDRTDEAIELADRFFPVHLSLPDLAGTNNPGNHIVTKAVALANAGRLTEAAELAEMGYGASVANRSLIGQMWFALHLGRIAALRGDMVVACRWFREQIALCRGTGHRRPVLLGLAGLAAAEAQRGDAEAAAAAIAELDASPNRMIELFEVEEARGRAWAQAAAGDPERARRTLTEAAEAAERAGVTLLAALARLDALRMGAADQAEPLAAAATTCVSAIVDLAARWAAAGQDADALRAVARGFEELGCAMHAAEAHAAAGRAARRAGAPRAAAADEQRAAELARGVRASTPALTTVDAVVPLTAREREIASLAAQGLATKEVAARLFVSARTVSNHLQNIYTKLGISKRTELPDALRRLGADEDGLG